MKTFIFLLLIAATFEVSNGNVFKNFFSKARDKIKSAIYKTSANDTNSADLSTTTSAEFMKAVPVMNNSEAEDNASNSSSKDSSTNLKTSSERKYLISQSQIEKGRSLATQAKQLHHELKKIKYILEMEGPKLEESQGEVVKQKFKRYQKLIKKMIKDIDEVKTKIDGFTLMSKSPDIIEQILQSAEKRLRGIRKTYENLDKAVFSKIKSYKKSEAKDKQEDSEEQETDVLDEKPFNDGDQDNLEDENNESFS